MNHCHWNYETHQFLSVLTHNLQQKKYHYVFTWYQDNPWAAVTHNSYCKVLWWNWIYTSSKQLIIYLGQWKWILWNVFFIDMCVVQSKVIGSACTMLDITMLSHGTCIQKPNCWTISLQCGRIDLQFTASSVSVRVWCTILWIQIMQTLRACPYKVLFRRYPGEWFSILSLFLSNITQKVMNGFRWNFMEGSGVIKGTIEWLNFGSNLDHHVDC